MSGSQGVDCNVNVFFSYHQKYLLQRHPHLVTALDVDPGEDLIKNHVAARINGYIGGFGSVANFDKEWKTWGITEQMAEYIREVVAGKNRNH